MSRTPLPPGTRGCGRRVQRVHALDAVPDQRGRNILSSRELARLLAGTGVDGRAAMPTAAARHDATAERSWDVTTALLDQH